MKFSICVIEPEGFKYAHFLYDICKYLCFGIESAGYECCIMRNKLLSDRINIIVGGHAQTDPAIVDTIRKSGDYIILQSEIITGNTINHWAIQDTFENVYLPLMKHAKAVWTGVESNISALKNLGVAADLLLFGYHPLMEEVHHKPIKDIDFLFCGSVTPHRKQLLEQLASRGGKVVTIFDDAAMYRNDLIARSRVNLAPNQGPGMNHFGGSRVLYLINNRSMVVVERCHDQKIYEHCFLSAETAHWVDLCLETIKRPDLDQVTEERYERFKKIRMVDYVQPLIEKLDVSGSAHRNLHQPHSADGGHTSTAGGSLVSNRAEFEHPMTPGMFSIIITSFNPPKDVQTTFDSIRRHTPEPHEIILVTGTLLDKSMQWYKDAASNNPAYRLIENEKNPGLPERCNQGIAASRGEHIVLCNGNVIVTAEWLTSMMGCLGGVENAGIAGPMTNDAEGIQKVDRAVYQSVEDLPLYAADFRVRHRYRRAFERTIDSFCMLFKRELVDHIGLLDDKLGPGGPEFEDYCLRAALGGYQNIIVGDVFIHNRKTPDLIARNRRTFDSKWRRIDSHSSLGKLVAVLNSVEGAEQLYRKQEIDQAVLRLIEGLKYSPDSVSIYFKLAEILIDAKQFDKALEGLNSAPEDARRGRKWNTLVGYCKLGLGLFDDAETYADRALLRGPSYAPALTLKGLLANRNENHDASRSFFEEAINSDPCYGEPYSHLGNLCWLTGDKETAFDLLEKGFDLSPKSLDPISLYHSAVTELKDYNRAERSFLEASSFCPGSRRLDFLTIDILIQKGDYNKAMSRIEKAILEYGVDDGLLAAALDIRGQIGVHEIGASNKSNTLSVCMITKNEEHHIAKCLAGIQSIANEIIVVDTGSTDRTRKIAEAFGARVYSIEWTDDFAKARNCSLSKAGGDWLLVLDADETISPQDHGRLRSLITRKNGADAAYTITTRNYVTDIAVTGWVENRCEYTEEAGTGWFPSAKVRLFRNDKRIRFKNPIHETLEESIVKANILIRPCDIVIHHYGKLDREKNLRKGHIYYEMGKKKLAQMPDDNKALYELAVQTTELGKYEESIPLWNRLIEKNKDKPNAVHFLNLGSAHQFLGRYVDAIVYFKKAIQLDPQFKEATLNYTTCEFYGGEPVNAIPYLERILKNNPLYPPAFSLLAATYCLAGKIQEAADIFETLKRQNYTMHTSMNDLCTGLINRGRGDGAAKILQTLVDTGCADNDTLQLLVQCHLSTEHS